MKKKYFTKEEVRRKAYLEYLSRRDFVKKGLLAGTSLAAGPEFIGKLIGETTAYAASGPASFKTVLLNCRGGWGNAVVPRDAAGNPLTGAGLGRFGVRTNILSLPNKSYSLFGSQFFSRAINQGTATEESDFIQGLCNKITGNTDPTTFNASLSNPDLQRIQMAGICNDGQDDNGTNAMGCNGVLTAAGFKGLLVDSIGTRNTTTGMSATSVLAGAPTPFIAPGFEAINDLLAYTPALKGKTKIYLDNFANAIKRLGSIQAPKILEKATKRDLAVAAANAAHEDNLRFTDPNNTANFDAVADPLLNGLFSGLTFNNGTPQTLSQNNQLRTFASALNALLQGQVNTVTFDLAEGYDYHQQIAADNGATLGTRSRDRIVGQHVGAVLRSFLSRGQNGIVGVFSDGATGGNPDDEATTIWTGDRGQQCIFQFWVVVGNLATPMPIRNPGKEQIGSMLATGSVDTTQFSGKGDMAAASVFAANILSLNGVSPDDILRIFPSFSTITNLMAHLIFKV